MRVAAAILAAGRGERFGGDKTGVLLGGRPVWQWSYDAYQSHAEIQQVILVTAEERVAELQSLAPDATVVAGGASRQESSKIALDHAGDAEILLIHDAARPFVSHRLIGDVVAAIRTDGAAAAALPVTDTIKERHAEGLRTLDRESLVAMQTPQGARVSLLQQAHAMAAPGQTDDMALLEFIGIHPVIVMGDPNNFKITNPEDLHRARSLVGGETRTGIGYDVHPFSTDPERTLWLGGVAFPGHPALDGHSDADALLHAATDALLGAAALGDIGQHFPNTDPQWRGQPSLSFLRYAGELLRSKGWRVVHLDMTCVAESPKIMKRADEIRQVVGEALGITSDRISIKATTNERMGFVGRGEGIAAIAVATIQS